MVVAVPFPWTCGLTSTAGRPARASVGQTNIAVTVMRRIRRRSVAIGRLLSSIDGTKAQLKEQPFSARPPLPAGSRVHQVQKFDINMSALLWGDANRNRPS